MNSQAKKLNAGAASFQPNESVRTVASIPRLQESKLNATSASCQPTPQDSRPGSANVPHSGSLNRQESKLSAAAPPFKPNVLPITNYQNEACTSWYFIFFLIIYLFISINSDFHLLD
jgi:hypothetical protein